MDENTKHIIASILTVAYFQTTPHKMSLATAQKDMNPNTEAELSGSKRSSRIRNSSSCSMRVK